MYLVSLPKKECPANDQRDLSNSKSVTEFGSRQYRPSLIENMTKSGQEKSSPLVIAFCETTFPSTRSRITMARLLRGLFYQPELQKIEVRDDDTFKVEKILKTKGRGHNKQYLVKWLHWPSKFNSWIKQMTYRICNCDHCIYNMLIYL